MKLIKEHKFIATLILIAVISTAAVFAMLSSGTEKDSEAQTDSIAQTIYDRALQCYVIEGAYPESLAYLEENYGLAVNKQDYKIVYTPYADNLPPEIRVLRRKEGRS